MPEKYFCRALDCPSNYHLPKLRLQHEQLMHKTLTKDAAVLLLDKINNSNSIEALGKKVLKTTEGNYSYSAAKDLIHEESIRGKAILKSMVNVVNTYFAHDETIGTKELLTILDFKVK